MRLNKYIAACGAASRRGADELIAQGRVTVNGNVPESMGVQVDPDTDEVRLNGDLLFLETQQIYIMLHKPAGVLSACSDSRGRTTVIDLLGQIGSRVFPVGRLDLDTEGLLLLTNDGDFAYRCTHPKHEVPKKYYAVVKGVLSDAAIDTLRGSVNIDGSPTSGADITVLSSSSKRTELTITIREGKNRQIKKMFQLAGCRVSYLRRDAIGGLTLGSLPVGSWRRLSSKDIAALQCD